MINQTITDTNRINNFREYLNQYDENFIIKKDKDILTATSSKFIEQTNEQKELELINFHKQILKNDNILLMRKFKENQRNKIFNSKKSSHSVSNERKQLIDALSNKDNGFNLALTLNFNPSNLTGTFQIQQVQNKVNEWWKLYCKHILGRNSSKYNSMSYIGVIEHIESNIHVHLAIKSPEKSITDEFIFDEETAIQILWKTVQCSGSVYLDKIYSDGWFYYMTKCPDFMNKLIYSSF